MRKRCSIQQGEKGYNCWTEQSPKMSTVPFFWATRYSRVPRRYNNCWLLLYLVMFECTNYNLHKRHGPWSRKHVLIPTKERKNEKESKKKKGRKKKERNIDKTIERKWKDIERKRTERNSKTEERKIEKERGREREKMKEPQRIEERSRQQKKDKFRRERKKGGAVCW